MRSLFLKNFLWFWVAQALISVVMFTVTEALRTERGNDRWRTTTNYALSLYARAAAAAYETGGPKALLANLEQAKGEAHTRTFVFDEHGTEVLGRSFPGAARTLAARAARSDEAEFTFSNDYMLSARATRQAIRSGFTNATQAAAATRVAGRSPQSNRAGRRPPALSISHFRSGLLWSGALPDVPRREAAARHAAIGRWRFIGACRLTDGPAPR